MEHGIPEMTSEEWGALAPLEQDPHRNPFFLNWSQLEGILHGRSPIDLAQLGLRSREHAAQFALEYGIDLSQSGQRNHAERVHGEALEFLRQWICDEEEWKALPAEVSRPESLLDLVVLSSSQWNGSRLQQLFACAVLKVMHIIFHIDFDLRLRFFDQIRGQVFSGFERLVVTKGQRQYLQDGKQSIPLVRYLRKRNKDRASMILKLLHKSQTTAADIYDHLGMRLVFNTRFECLFAMRLLQRNHLITYTNMKPNRCRNTLVDLRTAHGVYTRYRQQLAATARYPTQLLQKMDRELLGASRPSEQWDNPFSSDEYRAIQITARRMIHAHNPYFSRWAEFAGALSRLPGVAAEDLVRQIQEDLPEIPFYFDYEIQLQDKESYRAAIVGPASHKAYKERQRLAARKRVLGPELLRLLREG